MEKSGYIKKNFIDVWHYFSSYLHIQQLVIEFVTCLDPFPKIFQNAVGASKVMLAKKLLPLLPW